MADDAKGRPKMGGIVFAVPNSQAEPYAEQESDTKEKKILQLLALLKEKPGNIPDCPSIQTVTSMAMSAFVR